MLEQVLVAHGLTGTQAVTGALSAFLAAKEHAGGLCLSLSGFVYLEKVDQSFILFDRNKMVWTFGHFWDAEEKSSF